MEEIIVVPNLAIYLIQILLPLLPEIPVSGVQFLQF